MREREIRARLQRWISTPRPPKEHEVLSFLADITPRQIAAALIYMVGHNHGLFVSSTLDKRETA